MPIVPHFLKFDADGTQRYGVFGPATVGRKPAKTSGSSTSITAVTAGDAPFQGLQVGAELQVNRDGTNDVVYLAAIADDDNATTDAAVNWQTGPQSSSGRHFKFRQFLVGTTAADGWVECRRFKGVKIQFVVHSYNSTGITFSIEGRNKFTQTTPTVITTKQFTATGSDFVDLQPLDAPWDEFRVGVQVTGDSGANSVSAASTLTP